MQRVEENWWPAGGGEELPFLRIGVSSNYSKYFVCQADLNPPPRKGLVMRPSIREIPKRYGRRATNAEEWGGRAEGGGDGAMDWQEKPVK